MELGGKLGKSRQGVYVSMTERREGKLVKPSLNFTVRGAGVEELRKLFLSVVGVGEGMKHKK